jgi:methylmalonyl-CoA/ethylmalonyl-CoA epimerase
MRLHHIGKVVKDLSEARASYAALFGLTALGEPVIDPLQQVAVQFLAFGPGSSPVIELVSPISRESPVSKFLERGGGLHHFCFEVDNILKATEELRRKGALVLGNPVPGKGHGDRMTVWIYTTTKELIELVEAEKDRK